MCDKDKHTWEFVIKVPKGPCGSARVFKCTTCGDVKEVDDIKHKGYQREVRRSGSSDWGLTITYICDTCGQSYRG